MTTIVWFRQDLRLRDNPALSTAAARGPIVPVFILDDTDKDWAPAAASLWWLHHSLTALGKDLNHLSLYRGDPQKIIPKLVKEAGADAVLWNRCYEPHAMKRDAAIIQDLQRDGIAIETFNASLLNEPSDIKTGGGTFFKVFTPYWNAARRRDIGRALQKPKTLTTRKLPSSESLDDWQLLPHKPNWAKGFSEHWTPGEDGAIERFKDFAAQDLTAYTEMRDRPDKPGSSRLSPHLHWGEISPRQIHAYLAHHAGGPAHRTGATAFMREIYWREFTHHMLFHFPALPKKNWKEPFDAYPWRTSKRDLEAWQRGQTGYPLVDAGMRELWHTGTMHNRVRMITASFLIKHLRIDWRIGEAWFWDTLCDADLANNAANWQWVAGSGADASPYFRIFNPVLQGQKFDPNGGYVRQWCPELSKMPDKFIHAPWKAESDVLAEAGVKLGKDYPAPIVDHDEARAAALVGYKKVRSAD